MFNVRKSVCFGMKVGMFRGESRYVSWTRVVQGEGRGKLAWPLLSRSPHSPLHLKCNGKGTTFPLRFTNVSQDFF